MDDFMSSKRDAAYLLIAAHNKCDLETVYESFTDNPDPSNFTPESLNSISEIRKQLEQISADLNATHKSMAKLPDSIRRSLESVGHVTSLQIKTSAEISVIWSDQFQADFLQVERRGGKNWAGEFTAWNVAGIFDRQGRRITFGHNDGTPSTPFGRAVEQAFHALEIDADWLGPARRVFQQIKNGAK